jgi:hypothetical protein
MSSKLLKRIIVTIEWSLLTSCARCIDGSLNEISIRKLFIDAIKHFLVTTLLLIDLISEIDVALMVFIHSILISSVQPRFAGFARLFLRFIAIVSGGIIFLRIFIR